MILRGIDFGSIANASGACGFFGEGYPFHKYWKCLGMTWNNTGFVAKTMTLNPREGNMPLCSDGLTPRDFPPKCIYVDFFRGITVNAVGLSNKGAYWLLKQNRWQKRTDNFFLSFMAMGATSDEKLDELQLFTTMLRSYLPDFQGNVGLQLNVSCPNVDHTDVNDLSNEIWQSLSIASELEIPLVPKLFPHTPAKLIAKITRHPACDAISLNQTIPFGSCAEWIDWNGLFPKGSPLIRRGFEQPGGFSGPQALPVVADLIECTKALGCEKPLIGGNGIRSKMDAEFLFDIGADAIEIGSVAIVRPWRMRSIIAAGLEYPS